MYLLRQLCSNRVELFTVHRRHRRKKMMDQNFEIRILWFLRIFWNFQKGVARSLCGRSGRLFMVAAKLDQSRVLVTRFRQNRSTLQGRPRSAGQRHRQTDRETRLKITTRWPHILQVCNRAKNRHSLEQPVRVIVGTDCWTELTVVLRTIVFDSKIVWLTRRSYDRRTTADTKQKSFDPSRAESACRLTTSVYRYIHILKLVKRSFSETEDFTTWDENRE